MCVYVCIFYVYMVHVDFTWQSMFQNAIQFTQFYNILQLYTFRLDMVVFGAWFQSMLYFMAFPYIYCHALRPKETLNHMFVEDAVQAVKAFQTSGARLG